MNKKKRVWMVTTLGVLFFLLYVGRIQYQQGVQSSIAGKVIRFHVLANSDNDLDQKVKLKVRDSVGRYMEELLKDSKGIDETRQIIRDHLYDITKVANNILEEEGMEYRGIASLTHSNFPRKEYEGYVFPEGEYEALRIVLGKGEGHNWWCVMYPNLCFSSSIYKTNKREWKKFKQELTPKEYRKIMESGNFTIGWKFLEYFK